MALAQKEGIQAIYFGRHDLPTPAERWEGRKLGRLVDKGFRIHLSGGRTFEISTFGWDCTSITEESQKVKQIIENQLGKTNLNINFS